MKLRTVRTVIPAAILLLILGCAQAADLTELRVGEHLFYVEIAATPEARQRGLMHRESLEEDHGMLFVFPQEQIRSFWMRNTSIPLSIAYIDRRGRVMEIYDMVPFSEAPVTSRFPAAYALEVNQGRFEEVGVEPGSRVDLSAVTVEAR